MSDDPFDQELKTAFASPELPHDFVHGVVQDIARRHRVMRWRWTAAASVLVALGALAWFSWPQRNEQALLQALAQLNQGKLGVEIASRPHWPDAGERFALVPGARLRTTQEGLAQIDIETLGTLTLERESQVEVRAMDWKQFGSGAALGAITVGVIAGAVEWRSGDKSQRAVAGEELKLQASEASVEASGGFASWKKDKEDLLAKLDQAQLRVAELEKAATRAPVAVIPEPEMAKAPEPVLPKKLGVRFGDPDFQKVLEEVDWDKAGEAFKNMAPLMDDLTEAFENDKPLPKSVADLQKWNSELVVVALKVMNAGVPGTGVNGSFTHPAVAGNQIYSTLEKVGQPLSESQQASLEAVTKQFSSEDAARRSAYGEETAALRQLLEETALKDRYYAEAGKLLNPTQYSVLYPERRVGRLGADLYSSGLVYAQVTKGIPVKDRSDFEGQIQDNFARKFKLDDAGKAHLASIVRDWSSRNVSDSVLGYVPDKLAAKGMHKVGKVREAAELQLALQEKILKEMNLTPSQKKALLKSPEIWIPIFQKD